MSNRSGWYTINILACQAPKQSIDWKYKGFVYELKEKLLNWPTFVEWTIHNRLFRIYYASNKSLNGATRVT